MRTERPSVIRIIWIALVLFYAVLGLVVLLPEAVYSGDIGVKFVQARALAANRFASLAIPYPGAFLDTERAFFPIRPPSCARSGVKHKRFFHPRPPSFRLWR